MRKYIISVDGPLASGKGTVSRRLAKALSFFYLDTGLLYRCVARHALYTGIDLQDETAVEQSAKILDIRNCVDHKSLRTEEISAAASIVAQHAAVRESLLAIERGALERLPEEKKGIVVDGRDIGTVVFPDADFKFYITATAEERAKRRWKELHAKGELCTLGDVLQELTVRDDRDSNREVSPLKVPKGAFVIDTTSIGPEEAAAKMLKIVRSTENI